MTLHDDIAKIAGPRPAVYVGAETLSGVSFDTFRSQIETMVGVHVPTVTDRFYAKLLSAQTVGGASAKKLEFRLRQDASSIYLEASGGLRVIVEFGAAEQDPAGNYLETKLAQIDMLVKDVYVSLKVSSDKIAASPSNAVFIPTITRVDDFDDLCSKLGLDQVQASRVEGTIAYSGIQTIISSLLREPQVISLTTLFPGVLLLGQIEAQVTPGREAILIIPGDGVQTQPGAVCDCADTIDGIGVTQPGSATPDGKFTIGGPTVPAAGAVKLGSRARGIGESGLYMPLALAEIITAGPPPITKTEIGQNGFVGWDAQAVVDWKVRTTWFDTNRGVIMVRWFAEPGSAFAVGDIWVDLGKLGKHDIASFTAKQQPSPSTFTVALFPDAIAGMTTLHPIVEAIDMGDFFIEPSIKSLVMAPFSGLGAILTFIAETIMNVIVAHNVPIELTRRLKEYLATVSWKIQDLSYMGVRSHSVKNPLLARPVVLYDAKTDSMLLSGQFGD